MESISAPWVDTGQVPTGEGLIVWLRRGRWLFVVLIIIALVATHPLPRHSREWHDFERHPLAETVVSTPSQTADITVVATPDYHGDS